MSEADARIHALHDAAQGGWRERWGWAVPAGYVIAPGSRAHPEFRATPYVVLHDAAVHVLHRGEAELERRTTGGLASPSAEDLAVRKAAARLIARTVQLVIDERAAWIGADYDGQPGEARSTVWDFLDLEGVARREALLDLAERALEALGVPATPAAPEAAAQEEGAARQGGAPARPLGKPRAREGLPERLARVAADLLRFEAADPDRAHDLGAAWEWLREHGSASDRQLPSRETWLRYARDARDVRRMGAH